LTPRDIQARIRAGATAEEVAAESGMDIAAILRYEGPVMAERDYMAHQAQQDQVASPIAGHDGYRSAFGDNPATLAQMVSHRLKSFGVDPATVEWDSWRRSDGSWDVVVRFELQPDSKVDVGEEPPAQWSFNPARKTVTNSNRWAQVLSELEPLDGPLPSRRLSAVADRVFDFEADAAADEAQVQQAAEKGIDPDNLLAVLRSRRGQRLGADEDGDDALALMLSKGAIPAAHPREVTGNDGNGLAPAAKQQLAGLSLASSVAEGPSLGERDEASALPILHDGVSTETREITIVAGPQPAGTDTDRGSAATVAGETVSGETAATGTPAENVSGGSDRVSEGAARDAGNTQDVETAGAGVANDEAAKDAEADGAQPAGAEGAGQPKTGKPATEQPERRQIKPKRSSVPSWDEIVFGRKND